MLRKPRSHCSPVQAWHSTAPHQPGHSKIWAINSGRQGRGGEGEGIWKDKGWGVLSYHCANRCHIHLLNKYVPGSQCMPGMSLMLASGREHADLKQGSREK